MGINGQHPAIGAIDDVDTDSFHRPVRLRGAIDGHCAQRTHERGDRRTVSALRLHDLPHFDRDKSVAHKP
jgi:hypothetical protein